MKLFSNVILSWPQVVHLYQLSRIYPGKLHNYYMYSIKNINPLIIHTYSPLELLQENRKYYVYDKYYRYKGSESLGNNLILASLYNNSQSQNKLYLHIPKYSEVNDIIIVNTISGCIVPNIFSKLVPTLQ